jgi:hypothetical protein
LTSTSSRMNLYHPEAISEQNASIAARLVGCLPAVTSLAVYCCDPTTLANLTPHWQASLYRVKLVRCHAPN